MDMDDVLFVIVVFPVFVLPILTFLAFLFHDAFISCIEDGMYSKRHKVTAIETENRAIAVCSRCGRRWDITKEEAAIVVILENERNS